MSSLEYAFNLKISSSKAPPIYQWMNFGLNELFIFSHTSVNFKIYSSSISHRRRVNELKKSLFKSHRVTFFTWIEIEKLFNSLFTFFFFFYWMTIYSNQFYSKDREEKVLKNIRMNLRHSSIIPEISFIRQKRESSLKVKLILWLRP